MPEGEKKAEEFYPHEVYSEKLDRALRESEEQLRQAWKQATEATKSDTQKEDDD